MNYLRLPCLDIEVRGLLRIRFPNLDGLAWTSSIATVSSTRYLERIKNRHHAMMCGVPSLISRRKKRQLRQALRALRGALVFLRRVLLIGCQYA